MSENTWNVDVGEDRHVITVVVDPKTGRAAIRVDGRIAAKPLAPEETERDVPVAGLRYLVRRLDKDTFDLDMSPDVYMAETDPVPEVAVPQERGGKSHLWIWIVAIVVIGAAVVFGRAGWIVLQYSRVPWTSYSPADSSFKVKFAGAPTEATETRDANGDAWSLTTLSSQYKTHSYGVAYVDTQRIVTSVSAQPLIEQYFSSWATQINGSVVSQEATTISGNPARKFILRIAPSAEGTVRTPAIASGVVAFRNKRVFFVYAIAPESHKSLPDLREFVSSFELQPPPPATLKL